MQVQGLLVELCVAAGVSGRSHNPQDLAHKEDRERGLFYNTPRRDEDDGVEVVVVGDLKPNN